MIRNIALAFAVLAVAAVPAAAEPVSYLDFGKGPAQWIMTAEEQRAWRSIKTEEQARDFVDLFWARRDPTPGTPINEFRQEFESRVLYADKNFQEGRRRGSLTERGRVLAVLGFPSNNASASREKSAQRGIDPLSANDPTGGRETAARDVWIWEHKDAQKFGMPKIEVVFVFDVGINGGARRDPQRTDFSSALPGAIKSYIISPDMTQVPSWAKRTEATIVVPAETVVTETVTTTTVKRTVVDRPAPVARPAGVGKLTLLHDISSLQAQSGTDPFASLSGADVFRRDQDLGWAAEYCSGMIAPEPPTLAVELRISGGPSGDPVNMHSEPEQFVPDSIKASPGCYLVRGSLPLADVEPGSYTLTVTITGPKEQNRYNLTREFRIE